MRLASFLAATLVLSCTKEPPACRPEELARIEAAFVAEALEACRGRTLDTCDTYPAIKAKYSSRREAWVSCR